MRTGCWIIIRRPVMNGRRSDGRSMTVSGNTRRAGYPGKESLPDVGKAAILVPLIIGGAVIVAIIVLWQTHAQKIRVAQMARTEELARMELRAAYLEMRALRPEAALKHTGNAAGLLKSLKTTWPSDYVDLRIPLLLMEGESLFMKDCALHAVDVEKRFDQAIGLMRYASGETWQFGMLGRARARIEQGRYKSALGDLDVVLERNPSYGSAYYWRSLARKNLGDAAGASEDEKRARNLDSWPPLRDFMQASCIRTRDILCEQDGYCPAPPEGEIEGSLVPFFISDED